MRRKAIMTKAQKENLRSNVIELFKELKKVSQATNLRRKAKISPTSLVKWRSGKQRPTIKTAKRICEILGVDLEDMMNKKIKMELVFNISFEDTKKEL